MHATANKAVFWEWVRASHLRIAGKERQIEFIENQRTRRKPKPRKKKSKIYEKRVRWRLIYKWMGRLFRK